MILILNPPMPMLLLLTTATTTTMMMMMMSEMNAYASADSHDSDIDNNLLALPEEGRRGARKATEELRCSAQESKSSEDKQPQGTRYATLASDF